MDITTNDVCSRKGKTDDFTQAKIGLKSPSYHLAGDHGVNVTFDPMAAPLRCKVVDPPGFELQISLYH